MISPKRWAAGFVVILALMLLFAMSACSKGAGAGKKVMYHCPMHPTVISDRPGDCPICGMRLVPFEPAATGDSKKPAPEAAQPSAKKTMWRSTMNPDEVSDHPGKDSMGMEMVPFTVEVPKENAPQGLTSVGVSPQEAQRIGLTYGTVGMRALSKTVRTSARIVPDETRLFRVNTKVGGWVDKLYVDTTGQAVRRGQPLLSIYSPDLVASQQELLSALAAAKELEASPDKTVASGGRDLVDAAEKRLKLWDVTDAQIESIEKTGRAERDVTLYSPASGFVTEKDVLAGQRVTPGDPLMVIADLSTVWAESDIYESDLPYVKVGMPVEVTLPYWPGKTFEGKVSLLNPFLDPATRTMKARLVIPNKDLDLKPEMYGDAVLSFGLGTRLAIPDSAVLPTGEHNYAFIANEDGSLSPVDVKLGSHAGGYYEVLSGIGDGQRVVTSANFLIDSESSLKAALQAVAATK